MTLCLNCRAVHLALLLVSGANLHRARGRKRPGEASSIAPQRSVFPDFYYADAHRHRRFGERVGEPSESGARAEMRPGGPRLGVICPNATHGAFWPLPPIQTSKTGGHARVRTDGVGGSPQSLVARRARTGSGIQVADFRSIAHHSGCMSVQCNSANANPPDTYGEVSVGTLMAARVHAVDTRLQDVPVPGDAF